MTTAEVRQVLDELFEEEALVLGGLVEMHAVSDDFVEQLFRSLAMIRDHALERIGWASESPPASDRVRNRPRPAVERFLSRLGSSRTELD